jgi:hypothetical protein
MEDRIDGKSRPVTDIARMRREPQRQTRDEGSIDRGPGGEFGERNDDRAGLRRIDLQRARWRVGADADDDVLARSNHSPQETFGGHADRVESFR